VTLAEAGERLVDAAWAGLDRDPAAVEERVDERLVAAHLDRLIGNLLDVWKTKAVRSQPSPGRKDPAKSRVSGPPLTGPLCCLG